MLGNDVTDKENTNNENKMDRLLEKQCNNNNNAKYKDTTSKSQNEKTEGCVRYMKERMFG